MYFRCKREYYFFNFILTNTEHVVAASSVKPNWHSAGMKTLIPRLLSGMKHYFYKNTIKCPDVRLPFERSSLPLGDSFGLERRRATGRRCFIYRRMNLSSPSSQSNWLCNLVSRRNSRRGRGSEPSVLVPNNHIRPQLLISGDKMKHGQYYIVLLY